jgi:transcriptional regulator with XRE-family HTH domain
MRRNGIGKEIAEARKAAGLTQKEVADKLGMTVPGVGHWEQGFREPSLETLNKLARLLKTKFTVG